MCVEEAEWFMYEGDSGLHFCSLLALLLCAKQLTFLSFILFKSKMRLIISNSKGGNENLATLTYCKHLVHCMKLGTY